MCSSHTNRPAGLPQGTARSNAFQRIRLFMVSAHGNQLWDGIVRGTGGVGLVGIALVYLVPASGPLIGLGIFTVWISGPLSPLFPVGLEPVLMLFGRLYSPWLVAATTTLVGAYIEFLNYHLYGHVASHQKLSSVRESRAVRWSRRLFEHSPFFATWFCAFSPLPFWIIRFLAPLAGYPISKYLIANALGRYPKHWLFAAAGVWLRLSTHTLIWVAVAGILSGLVIWVGRSVMQKYSDASSLGEDLGQHQARANTRT